MTTEEKALAEFGHRWAEAAQDVTVLLVGVHLSPIATPPAAPSPRE